MRKTVVAVLSLIPAAVSAQDLRTVTYACERGVRVPATYVPGIEDIVVLNVEGRQITLGGTRYEDRVSYVWPSDGSGSVWTVTGPGARLDWFDAEAGGSVTVYADCAED